MFAPFAGLTALLAPSLSFAAESTQWIDLTSHPVGYAALSVFVLASVLVMAEELLHLPPVVGMLTGLGYLRFVSG
ncbi:hypothetical protein [Thiocapsa sp.]|uniref:hypothetical protein n=1 Tax=Thiocapsa sp. TaxID=2024551 RepID=UPI003593AE9B